MTKFFNWQSSKPGTPYTRASPNLTSLLKYLNERYSGQSLGIYSNRPITAGTSPSSHAFGAAVDWRYQNPGPGRQTMTGEILPFLIDHSQELGIQAIHDYFGCQVWRAGRGWAAQRKGSHGGSMGASWATWLHIEVHPDHWGDNRSVMEKIGFNPVADPDNFVFPEFNPRNGKFGLFPISNKPTVKLGASGDAVRYLQGVILNKAGGGVVVDGSFGPQTNRRVRDFQAFFKTTVDGIVGPKTWAIVDRVANS